jgi:superfamily II DNA or RNA helicase
VCRFENLSYLKSWRTTGSHLETDQGNALDFSPATMKPRFDFARAEGQPAVPAALAAAVTPSGLLRIDVAEDDAVDGLPAAARARLIAAFDRGAGHAILYLGLSHVETTLSPSLALVRDVGRCFATRLCAEPDLEDKRERAIPAATEDDIAAFLRAPPPMRGAEYLEASALRALWDATGQAFVDEIRAFSGSVQDYLRVHGAAWNVVGRVCFHLAENRTDPDLPFAFLATYATRATGRGKVVHAPLSRALAESSARGDKASMLSLLVPVQRASEHSPLVKELLNGGDLYHPLAWTPAEAYRFLREIPKLEAAGVVVRVPDWWRARRPPRPEVQVTVGTKGPGAGTLGVEAMLDFRVDVTLDSERLTAVEVRALLARHEGLALVRGKWVELDRDKLRDVLDHWQQVQRDAGRDGLSFLEGMRLLAGAPIGNKGGVANGASNGAAEWTRVKAGDWLGKTLAGLRGPDGLATADPGDLLRATLRPYQRTGVNWLWFASRLRLGVCLADDMGLGKTIQVLALLLLEQRAATETPPPHLLVVPASLLGNWQAEAAHFAPSLRMLVAHASAIPAKELTSLPEARLASADVVLTTYATAARMPWIADRRWSLLVLDEAQAIKNPSAGQTRAVKALRARSRIALTGTPVENRLGDLWSIFDFLNPGLLGSAKHFAAFVNRLAERPSEPYAPLRRLVEPYLLRRLKSDKRVVADLPDKTELKAFCGLARTQAALYQRSVEDLSTELRTAREGIRRRGVVLAYLMRFKQICNHPAHWLRDGPWAEADSGKLARLRELGEDIASRQEKALVFTQFREATDPLAAFLAEVFGRPGLVLHGDTPIKQRAALVARFQDDERVPFFVLSLKAGGAGLNLTAASHVIHFDRWWNPAVENQATDRAYRIGQRKNVLVHKLICRGTIEERIDALIEAKQGLAQDVVGSAEALLTEMRDEQLMNLVALDLARAALDA